MTSALRKKLLSLAIRGKLVPQDPADEPASVLLERIRAERESKESAAPRRGRGRRSSSDNPPCPKRGTSAAVPAGVEGAAFEPPFPIPESWVWTRLGTILKVPPRNGYSPKPVANKTKTKRLTLTATTSGNFKPEEFKYVADEVPFNSYLWLKPGDLLVQRSNSIEHIGTSCIFTGKPHEYIYPDLMMKLVLAESLDVEFFDLVLKSDNSLHYFQRNATGSAGSMPKINKEILENTTIPLPPVSEQHAIVARFKKLSSLCDAIDTAVEEIDSISRHAKSRILDLAIRGLLVSQNPTDEPASNLLNRIRLTTDKPPCPKKGGTAEPIGISDPLFPIPESWEWTTLGEIGEVVRGTGIKRSDMSETGRPCVRYGEIYTTYSLKTEKVVSFVSEELFRSSKHVQARSVLMTLTGEDRKDIAKTIAYLGDEPIAISGDMLGICPREVEPLYLSFVLNSPWAIERKGKLATGDLVIHISQKSMSCFPVPLPPLAEQRRIVAKVAELFSVIDAMATK